MAYMREPFYVYRTGPTVEMHAPGGASLSMPIEVFDALVVMRYAQLKLTAHDHGVHPDGRLLLFERVVAEKYAGSFGCDALRTCLGLEPMMDAIRRIVPYAKDDE